MHPKSDIKKLNRMRELERRLRFVRKRMKDVATEFLYVNGTLPALPNGIKEPPKWALDAAHWVSVNCLKAPTANQIEDDVEGVWGETIAKYEGLVAFVTQAGHDETSNGDVNRVLRRLQKSTLELVDRDTLLAIKELDSDVDSILPALTAKELFELNDRRRRGLASVVNSEGELQVLKSAQAEIYYFIWFFWPIVQKMIPAITAAKLGKWLADEFGIHTSPKTVEIVFSKLRLAAFKKSASVAT